MTTDSELIALAERVEAATGPDRDIDISILRHVDPERLEWMNGQYAKGASELMALGPDAWEARKDALYTSCYTPPRYTASVDAAMTLYIQAPPFVPSCPRKATSEALRQRAEVANV